MPPFFSPRKLKAPIRIDTEQQATNSHYYTAFKVVLKITVIALVICIAFLPTVALRNKQGYPFNEVFAKSLEHPAKFDVSNELEHQVPHVPLRFLKSAKLFVQRLRIRGSTLEKLTDISASEQVQRSEDATDAATDGIQYGDYALGGSKHQAKSEIERLQHCSPEIKNRNGGKCIRQLTLPIRDDDRVISRHCSWQERCKHGGRCISHAWQPTPRSLIVDVDTALFPVHTLIPTSTLTPKVIDICSYDSEIKNGGKCPRELVNGPIKPAENKPISILVRPPPVDPNTQLQAREAAIDEETSVNYRPYKADLCRHGWARTTDGWCIYRGSFEHQTTRPEIFNDPPASERSIYSGKQRRGAVVNEPNKLEPRPFRAESCPKFWIHTNDGWCYYRGSSSKPLGVWGPDSKKSYSIATLSTKYTATTTSTHTSDPNSISTAISPTATLPPPTIGNCDPPWIRTMDGRCFFDPKYQRKHPQDPLTQPRKIIRQRRGKAISEERDVAPSWQADSCEPPWILTDDHWCIYRPGYKHGTQASLPKNTEQSSATGQSNATNQSNDIPQASATEQPDVTDQSTAAAQPTSMETVTSIRHCINDLRGNLQCFEETPRPWSKTTQVSSARNRRGLWPDDWVPQTPDDCERFVGNTFKHYQCLQSVKNKNVGLKLIMAFLLLAGFGSLIFLIITFVNRAASPKAQPFRQLSGVVDANGMTQHSARVCNTYPWNNKGDATNATEGGRWARGPPAYDPLRQLTPEHSGSLVACTRESNCASGSSDSTQNWIRKLCNRCFKTRTNSSLSDKEAQIGSVGNGFVAPRIHGMRSTSHRIDTLRLPSAKLATVRRASGLPSEENGDLVVNGSTETVVIGSVGKGSGSAVGMRGSDSGSAVVAGSLMKLENLSGDTLVESRPAMLECGDGKDGKDFGAVKMECLKTGDGNAKKVGFGEEEEFEEVRGWKDVERVEPLRVEKIDKENAYANVNVKRMGEGMGDEVEMVLMTVVEEEIDEDERRGELERKPSIVCVSGC
ncbi:hypothetical protein BofuT4_P080760.1 [Botrytis cinerea T4]|uniref:Uncharacterized protein n=1 Tax=Botryotinia fuckeliana (strain T4) TaxID=999810 RepID=G2YKY3_BOTF4|nr:hypothetical protein BofuT4_P080760.1 [Botrytis cinerea T4]